MLSMNKVCAKCGPVNTIYANCPRCWGPVRKATIGQTAYIAQKETRKACKIKQDESVTLERHLLKVADMIRSAKISEEEHKKLIDEFIEKSKQE